jgi:16S rRNA (cytosine1402-N4)-methyltransferase
VLELSGHLPVLLDEVITALRPHAGARIIDATINGGGHARALLERSAPNGRLLGLDRDPSIVASLRETAASEIAAGTLRVEHASFAELASVARESGFTELDGILFDLGLSSHHLGPSGRGFSFDRNEPLDMRFDPSDPAVQPVSQWLRRCRADELARIISTYGEERHARRIARRIADTRARHPIHTAAVLRDTVLGALPGPARRHGSRSVARVFQALRIATNRELEALETALPQVPGLLRRGGRVAVIAFHSLEDRIVKRFFRSAAAAGELALVTKRPLRPTEAESRTNPRARSARLRIAERPRVG